jgi:serine incorporator 1/3
MSGLMFCCTYAGCSTLNCFARALGIHDLGENSFRTIYFVSYFATQIVAWQLRDNSKEVFEENQDVVFKEFKPCTGRRCAFEACVRVALANVMFFSVMLVLTLRAKVPEDRADGAIDDDADVEDMSTTQTTNGYSRKKQRFDELSMQYKLHVAQWPFKLLLWLVFLCIAFFALPSQSVDEAFEVFRFGAGLFLLVQMVVVIASVYELNEYLVEKAESSNGGAIALVGGTVSAFALTIAVFVLTFVRYDCDGEKTIVAATSMSIVILFVCCCFSLMEDIRGGLFTSSVVCLYVAYLMCAAAMERAKTCSAAIVDYQQNDNSNNNSLHQSKDEEIVEIVGFIVQLAVVALSAFKAASGHRRFQGVAHVTDDTEDDSSAAYTFFHGVFLLASMHAAMLFVGWVKITQSDADSDQTRTTLSENTTESFWIKVTSAYFTALLYLWSLLAPKLLPDRDF